MVASFDGVDARRVQAVGYVGWEELLQQWQAEVDGQGPSLGAAVGGRILFEDKKRNAFLLLHVRISKGR